MPIHPLQGESQEETIGQENPGKMPGLSWKDAGTLPAESWQNAGMEPGENHAALCQF